MEELRAGLVSLNIGVVYLGLLLTGFVAIKLKPASADSLFVWVCSFPLTVFCYVVWIHSSGGTEWYFITFLVEALALAQLGWLGAALVLAGILIKVDFLKKAGLWLSIATVIFHGFFLVLILIFGYGS